MKRKDTDFFSSLLCFQIFKVDMQAGERGKMGCAFTVFNATVSNFQTKMYTGRLREFCRRITKPFF